MDWNKGNKRLADERASVGDLPVSGAPVLGTWTILAANEFSRRSLR